MSRLVTAGLGLFALVTILLFYLASSDTFQNLSPQGCRMSWMSPSYILQINFNTSWSPLATRYSLWLYREVGWESNQPHSNDDTGGVPVLFIPGNAGSSRQVRSIASSATRQFYSSPYVLAPAFAGRQLKPLDFFAVEFNEDLSAFHGPTLQSQIDYTSRAISYILSLYPPNTSIIIMGHSMGGIVATSLLSSQSQNISTIITMSAPHTLPPARFDSRIDMIYAANQRILDSDDDTPIVSLCGGATDMMIPSESCLLLVRAVDEKREEDIYRRTVFTSALEGAWTGVGHREMVWCHQVRWRVARAALELGASATPKGRGVILDKWLRDGHVLPPAIPESKDNDFSLTDSSTNEILPADINLVLKKPQSSRTYLLPLSLVSSSSTPHKFVLFVSQGSIPPVSPQNPLPLRVSVHLCTSTSLSTSQNVSPRCGSLKPTILKLVPNPVPGQTFPVPHEGSDESEGVVFYQADVPLLDIEATATSRWVGVRVEGTDGTGWLVGGFSLGGELTNDIGTLRLLSGGASIVTPDQSSLLTRITFPNLLSNALVVYRITPKRSAYASTCSDPLFPPLIMHTSQSSEIHYFPVPNSPSHRILLHTHSPAPYIPSPPSLLPRGVNLTIYFSGFVGCRSGIAGFDVHVDWSATLGRWASRYPMTLASWAVGVVALVVFDAWGMSDYGAPMPSVQQSLSHFGRKTLFRLLFGSLVVSFIPLPEKYYLGNRGEPFFAPIAPLLLLLASGLVCISWWVLLVLMWPLGKFGGLVFGRRREKNSRSTVRKRTVVSMCLIFLLIFLFVPWQVAFLGCWLIHLNTCASSTLDETSSGSAPTPTTSAIPLMTRRGEMDNDETHSSEPRRQMKDFDKPWLAHRCYNADDHHHNKHLLLLMTWLLPLVAPTLAVWVRTLATAGLTTPFDGDHFFPNVAPFLVLVDFASWTTGPLFEKQRFENRFSVRWFLVILAITALFIGPRKAYAVFDAAQIATGLIVLIRIGPRYWGGTSWSSTDGAKRGQ